MKPRPVLILFAAAGLSTAFAQNAPEPLLSGFGNPPAAARPLVWWHWMNGNITQQGIQLDLDWMHRIGLAGFQNFDAALSTPQVVDKRLAYMTPEWKDAFRDATHIADQYGMEEAIAGSPGWSESGGPWVPPSEGMKKYVWSETFVEGGKPFTGTLAHPPDATGPFQNTVTSEPIPHGATTRPQFYADSVVLGYRRPASEIPADSLHAKTTASSGSPDIAVLSDGDLEKTTQIPIPALGKQSWIQYEFPAPTAIRAVTFATKDPSQFSTVLTGITGPIMALESSDDGQTFRAVKQLHHGDAPETTLSFPAVTAKYFRVTFTRGTAPPLPAWAAGIDPATMGSSKKPTDYEVAELVLHSGARVNNFEEKAAFVPVPDLYKSATTPAFTTADTVRKSDVIDLTSKMHPDGKLNWTPPPGHWVVVRFGYSLLGITNHPATAEATGFEVDKLDHRFVRNYMEKYLDSYKETVGPEFMGKRGIRFVINDSWEAGSQNWTDNMIEQFRKRRGYDPTPWMPVLTGHIVESSAASDRFLWDFRKTIADLIADEHYGELENVLHEWNMGHYGESHEGGRAFVADGMEVKKFNEVPMSAMWTQTPGVNKEQYGYNADDRESASVAHIYGRPLVAAESMTASSAPWGWYPSALKPTADQEFLNGINRFVIHESAHQPLIDKKPGLTLGPFGQWFNRNETWAEQARPWIDYLARTSYLLQQGRFAADIVYFYGEDSNLTAIFGGSAPNVPAGYGFDYINADALIHELSVTDGRLTTKAGASYRLLALDPYSTHMSLPVLQAIQKLVQAGATVAGPMPTDDPSLADDQAQFRRLRADLFGDGKGVHHLGKGTVYAGDTAGEALTAMKAPPDFDFTKPEPDTRLEFVHRKLADGDLYFIDNRGDSSVKTDATFRITGKAPELWYAETDNAKPASYTIAAGHTTVPLHLEPWGTVFVVFRKPAAENKRTIPAPRETLLATLSGPWTVAFPPKWGAPPTITLETLSSWSENADTGVKYFSGTGTYTRSIDVPAAWLANGAHVWVDLGDVKNLAEVALNGQSLGVVWHAPWRVDLTPALKPGSNQLSIQVTNAWVNRLIGDQQPGATKYTFTTEKPYKANSPLQPSGLLGPVTLTSITSAEP